MSSSGYVPLLEISRGKTVESVHHGAVAVVDTHGKLLASSGDADIVTFLRSSAKPFQALPFVEQNGAERFGLNDEEIAIMCSSHSGTDQHVRVVSELQRKIGISEKDLLCGSHYPFYEPLKEDMIRRGEKPTSNRHNCSGKHSGMLGQALLHGFPIAEYIRPDHPVQQHNLQVFSEMCSISISEVEVGIDGCSAPVYALPLRKAAFGYARLMDPTLLEFERAKACQRIVHAMTSYPYIVAGPGRFDTVLMEFGKGNILSKAGAEGFQAVGLSPGVLGSGTSAVGVTIKIADGDLGGRAAGTVAVAVLTKLGVLEAKDASTFHDYISRPVHNWRGLEVGEIRPCFELEWHE